MSPPLEDKPRDQKPQLPISFFSLPPELRQQVFLIAVEEYSLPPRGYITVVGGIWYDADLWMVKMRWVRQALRADVDFAAAMLKKRYEGLEAGTFVHDDGTVKI